MQELATSSVIEAWSYPMLLVLPAVIALGYRSNRRIWCVAVLLIALIFMLLMVIPNYRGTYLFYLVAPLFILAFQGPARLPRSWVADAVTVALALPIAATYLAVDVKMINTAWHHHQQNRVTEAQIRKLITHLGEPGDVTVMASGEFHAIAHDTRFRTFHSLLITKDLEQSLKQLQPELMILYPRALFLIGVAILDWSDAYGPKEDVPRLYSHISQALIRQNYRPHAAAAGLTWDGQEVRIYYRPTGQKQASD